jgi:hypothetical protein
MINGTTLVNIHVVTEKFKKNIIFQGKGKVDNFPILLTALSVIHEDTV